MAHDVANTPNQIGDTREPQSQQNIQSYQHIVEIQKLMSNSNKIEIQRNDYGSSHKGTVVVKDKQGNRFRISKEDPRWLSGELVGINKGKPSILKGRIRSEQVRNNISKGKRGVQFSQQHKLHISQSKKGVPIKRRCN